MSRRTKFRAWSLQWGSQCLVTVRQKFSLWSGLRLVVFSLARCRGSPSRRDRLLLTLVVGPGPLLPVLLTLLSRMIAGRFQNARLRLEFVLMLFLNNLSVLKFARRRLTFQVTGLKSVTGIRLMDSSSFNSRRTRIINLTIRLLKVLVTVVLHCRQTGRPM